MALSGTPPGADGSGGSVWPSTAAEYTVKGQIGVGGTAQASINTPRRHHVRHGNNLSYSGVVGAM